MKQVMKNLDEKKSILLKNDLSTQIGKFAECAGISPTSNFLCGCNCVP